MVVSNCYKAHSKGAFEGKNVYLTNVAEVPTWLKGEEVKNRGLERANVHRDALTTNFEGDIHQPQLIHPVEGSITFHPLKTPAAKMTDDKL